MIRLATKADVAAAAQGYEALFDEEERSGATTNWQRGLYPTLATAENAFRHGWLYVFEDETGSIRASMILNHEQAEEYRRMNWQFPAEDDRVLVLHTLCVDPAYRGRGCAKQMVRFAIDLAKQTGMHAFRLDTFYGNEPATALYLGLGFQCIGWLDVILQGLIPEKQKFFEMPICS